MKNLPLPGVAAALLLVDSLAPARAQEALDYSLRLEPVWTGIADALGEAGSVESAEFSRDGMRVVTGTKYDNSVVMWRTSDGTELWRHYVGAEVERAGFSADGRYVAACDENFLVTVFDADSGDTVRTLPHASGLDGLTWSHEGALLAVGEELDKQDATVGGRILIYDAEADFQQVGEVAFGATVNELFFSPDDERLLAVGHGAVRLYDADDLSVVQEFAPEYRVIFTSGALSPDGRHVIACGQSDRDRGTVYLWDAATGELLRRFNHTGKKIESITFHPGGDYVVYAGHDPYVHVYRLSDILEYNNDRIRETHRVWAGDHAEYVSFNADGSFLASAHQNGLVKVWAWMGEDPALNERRHRELSAGQADKQ